MTPSTPLTSPPPPSALTTLISSSSTPPTPHSATTAQILHNLRHQHLWTSLETHPLVIPQPPQSESKPESHVFLISGIPPHRVYTHPDEQLFLLEKGLREDELPPERMAVLPLAQGQAWSLRRMAAVFDSLGGGAEEEGLSLEGVGGGVKGKLEEYYERRKQARHTREWGGKKLLLAMVDRGMGGDGTVVYYVVQEGAVKPRQN